MSPKSSALNATNLHKIATANPTAEGIMLFLSNRERWRSYTTLLLLRKQLRKEGVKFVDDNFMKFFRDLENEGVGTLESKGKKFNWFYSLVEVSKMAIEGEQRELANLGSPEAKPTAKAPKSNTRKVRVKKSDDNKSFIQITIPRDLLKYIKTDAA